MCVLAALPSTAFGKRLDPVDVPPVSLGNVRYEAPHTGSPCNQSGGCVVAYDETTNAILWSVKVYCTHYDTNLEMDIQNVFITSLTVDAGRLLVVNEAGKHFSIDPATHAVSGDARGCDDGSSGCNVGPTASTRTTGGLLACLGGIGLLGTILVRHFRRGKRAKA